MAEFADACDKDQTLQAVAILQNAVESLQAALDIFDIRIQDVVKNRLVIFINQNDDFPFLG